MSLLSEEIPVWVFEVNLGSYELAREKLKSVNSDLLANYIWHRTHGLHPENEIERQFYKAAIDELESRGEELVLFPLPKEDPKQIQYFG